jgi:hypothetical protein
MLRDLLMLPRHVLELSSRLLLLALVVVMKKSHENQLKGLLGVVGGEKRRKAIKSIYGLLKLEMQKSSGSI